MDSAECKFTILVRRKQHIEMMSIEKLLPSFNFVIGVFTLTPKLGKFFSDCINVFFPLKITSVVSF